MADEARTRQNPNEPPRILHRLGQFWSPPRGTKQREQNETNAGNREAAKGFRRLEAYKHLPFSELRLQLINPSTSPNELNTTLTPHSIIHGDACFAYFGRPCCSQSVCVLHGEHQQGQHSTA